MPTTVLWSREWEVEKACVSGMEAVGEVERAVRIRDSGSIVGLYGLCRCE